MTRSAQQSNTPVLLTATALAADTASDEFESHGKRGIILYLDVDAVTGLTPTLDVKLQAVSPNGDFVDVPSAAFAQKTGAGTDSLVVYPGVAETANRSVSDVLPRVFRAYAAMNAAAAVNEVQTLTLTAGAAGDTFKLTFNAHESAAVTIPAADFHDVTAAQIKTALLTISDWTTKTADIAVVKTGDDYAITFSGTLGAQDIGAITVTSKTGTADGSVAETTKGVVAETWTGTISAHLIP